MDLTMLSGVEGNGGDEVERRNEGIVGMNVERVAETMTRFYNFATPFAQIGIPSDAEEV